MNNFVIDTPDNFWQIRWLDKYMEGHKGFIAGGCFKNILSGERVKDIDIFFESESDFQEAIDSFNDEKHQKEGWKFKYRNEKVCAFQKEGEKVWIEFIESEFGKPKEILRSFDFTVTKMVYYKEPKYRTKAGIECTEEECKLIDSFKRLAKKWKKDGKRLWIYSASGTLHVMMHGDTNYNPTPEFTQYGGSNIENSITIIDGIPNDGGDW